MFRKYDPLPLVWSTQETHTKCKERLREIRLNSVGLVMNIVIYRIVAKQELERIPREVPSTMIIDCFQHVAKVETYRFS